MLNFANLRQLQPARHTTEVVVHVLLISPCIIGYWSTHSKACYCATQGWRRSSGSAARKRCGSAAVQCSGGITLCRPAADCPVPTFCRLRRKRHMMCNDAMCCDTLEISFFGICCTRIVCAHVAHTACQCFELSSQSAAKPQVDVM